MIFEHDERQCIFCSYPAEESAALGLLLPLKSSESAPLGSALDDGNDSGRRENQLNHLSKKWHFDGWMVDYVADSVRFVNERVKWQCIF